MLIPMMEYLALSAYALFWLLLTVYLWVIYLPKAVERNGIERLLERLQDPNDADMQELFNAFSIRAFNSFTKEANPELNMALNGWIHGKMMKAGRELVQSIANEAEKGGGGMLPQGTGDIASLFLSKLPKIIDKAIESW